MSAVRRRIRASGVVRYDVDYTGADGRQRSKSFHTADDAAAFQCQLDQQHRRWPLEQLVERTGLDPVDVAQAAGADQLAAARAANHGLNDTTADHWAVANGYHPATIWGWTWVQAGLGDTEAAAEGARR